MDDIADPVATAGRLTQQIDVSRGITYAPCISHVLYHPVQGLLEFFYFLGQFG